MPETLDFLGCKYVKAEESSGSLQGDALAEALAILTPKACPYELIRVGGDQDGAYLLPNDLAGVAACYSPGVNNVKYFEDSLAHAYGIKSHMCDYSSDEETFQSPLIAGVQTFKKAWLDTQVSEESITLAEWVDELSPDLQDDLILQIDIEGAEYRNILSCPDRILKRFRIIAIELHALHALLDNDILAQVILPFLKRLDTFFVCVHAHPNNCCGEFIVPSAGVNVPNLIELTLLRKDRIALGRSAGLRPPQLPHPADIDRNVIDKPPIILNEFWTGRRTLPSQLKAVEEELSFQKYNSQQLAASVQCLAASLTLMSSGLHNRISQSLGIAPASMHAGEFIEEIGVGCDYTLSSSHAGAPLMGVVPENVECFFFHTDFGTNESITIDLGGCRIVKGVRFANRRDVCFDRAKSLFAIVHENPDWRSGAAFEILLPRGFSEGSHIEAHVDIPAIAANYVSIVSTAYTALHLQAVRVLCDGT